MLRRLILIGFAGGHSVGARRPISEPLSIRYWRRPTAVPATTPMESPPPRGFIFPNPMLQRRKIEAFGNSLVVLVDRDHPDNVSACCRKPTARIPHTGGERIKQGSPEEAVLKAWIARLTQLSGTELATALKYRELESAGTGAALRRMRNSAA